MSVKQIVIRTVDFPGEANYRTQLMWRIAGNVVAFAVITLQVHFNRDVLAKPG